MKIAMVSIFVSDPMKAHAYYTDVLGFKSRLFMPEHYLAIICSNEEPDGVGVLLEPNHNPIASTYQDALWKANLPCMVFGTDNIQADYENLQSKGVVFRKPPTKTQWGTETVFEDGFGNLIQLHEMPKA